MSEENENEPAEPVRGILCPHGTSSTFYEDGSILHYDRSVCDAEIGEVVHFQELATVSLQVPSDAMHELTEMLDIAYNLSCIMARNTPETPAGGRKQRDAWLGVAAGFQMASQVSHKFKQMEAKGELPEEAR